MARGSIDEAGTRALCEAYYPGVPIATRKLEDGGVVYYLFRKPGRRTCKSKARVSNGAVAYSYSG